MTTATTARTMPTAAARDTSAMVKALLSAMEEKARATARAAAEAEAKAEAEATAEAKAEAKAARKEAEEAADRYAVALYRAAWTRAESVMRRAYDAGAKPAPLATATEAEKAAAEKSGCNEIIRKLKPEAATAARRMILSPFSDEVADAYSKETVSDAADIIAVAVLSFLESAADRESNRAEAAAEDIGIFDFLYLSDRDRMKKPACDIKRANRDAERYINGRRGLALSDFRTLYYEAFSEEADAQEAAILYKRGGVYAALANDTYIGAYTVKNIDSILAALNLSATARRRLSLYIRGLNYEQIAARENVSRQAVCKSIMQARAACLKMLSDAAARATDANRANRADRFTRAADRLKDIADRAAADRAKPAPLYSSDYVTALFPPHISFAINAARFALSTIAEDAARAEFDIAKYSAKLKAEAARAAAEAANRNAAALDAKAAAMVTTARATVYNASDKSEAVDLKEKLSHEIAKARRAAEAAEAEAEKSGKARDRMKAEAAARDAAALEEIAKAAAEEAARNRAEARRAAEEEEEAEARRAAVRAAHAVRDIAAEEEEARNRARDFALWKEAEAALRASHNADRRAEAAAAYEKARATLAALAESGAPIADRMKARAALKEARAALDAAAALV